MGLRAKRAATDHRRHDFLQLAAMPETGSYQKSDKFTVTLVKQWQILVGSQGLVKLDPVFYRDKNIIGNVAACQPALADQILGMGAR